METRKNTLKIVFSNKNKVPVHLDILRFVAKDLKISAAQVHSIYRDENDQSFYLKFIDESAMNQFMEVMEEQYRFGFLDGQFSNVTLELASRQMRYIRIFNLPPETEDKDIAAVLSRFGKIRQHIRERYPASFDFPVFSGVRGVHMEVEKDIPANLFIGHFRARVYYEGLKNKCFFCKAEGHVKVNCPKLTSLRGADTGKERQEGGNNRLYSQVAANLQTARMNLPEDKLEMTLFKIPITPISKNPMSKQNNEQMDEDQPSVSIERTSRSDILPTDTVAGAAVIAAESGTSVGASASLAGSETTSNVTNDGGNPKADRGKLRLISEGEFSGVTTPTMTISPDVTDNDEAANGEWIGVGTGRGRGRKKKSETPLEEIERRSRSRSLQKL